MRYILTLIAARTATTLTDGTVGRVRDAVNGGTPDILCPGEAADIPVTAMPPDPLVRSALEGAPIDAITTPAPNRRKRLLIADMDSTIVTSETLDELADFAGLSSASRPSPRAP